MWFLPGRGRWRAVSRPGEAAALGCAGLLTLAMVAIIFVLEPAAGQSRQLPEPASGPAKTTPANALYRQNCQKCHGDDGSGKSARGTLPEIPDFRSSTWHEKRTEVQLITSVHDGKGTSMPAFATKLSKQQIQALVDYLRKFDSSRTNPGKDSRTAKEPPPPSDFDRRFRELQEEMNELQKQLREALQSQAKP